jgi:hypothetical protein
MKPTPASRILAQCVASLLAASAAAAQLPPVGTLAGRVLDAGTSQPVAAAVVTLELVATGLLIDPRAAAGLTDVRSIVTGESGGYRFADVAPGQYRLRIERLGYRAATVTVDVRRPADASVSVGLELDPVALEPVRVEQRAASLFQRATNAPTEHDDARIASERARQALFLSPDARVLTYADVMDGVTLGEGDVFRALQRFPGVGTRDDYTAELWTRGAPWTHTRVTFDGVPLFNPVHAVGVLSAIAPEVLGAVFFHPGVRPAAIGEGAAGVVDLRSRAGGGDGALRGVADLSMASAKVVLDQHVERRGAWVLAARRSHVNVLADGLDWLGLDTLDLPYVFHDVAARVDAELSARTRVEASGVWEEDRITGDVTGVLERTDARWGNTAGRVTLRSTLGRLELSQSVGASRFSARTDARMVRTTEPSSGWSEPAGRNDIRYTQVAGELSPAASGDPAHWSIGYDVAFQRVDYDGPLPRYHPVKPDTIGRMSYQRELLVAAVYGDTRVALGDRVTIQPGLRLETGDSFRDGAGVRVSPRVAVRLALSPDHAVSLAAGRSWQHVQAIALAGPSIHPAFHASHFWVWPDEGAPAIRADIVTIGSERWLGGGWLASINAFARHATGMTLPDPTPGLLTRRKALVHADNDARGVELNVRRIGAQWSTALGYTYGVSNVRFAERRYPSPADRRHVLDAMAGVRVPYGVRLAAAYTTMSGAPFTRAYSLSAANCTLLGFGCDNPRGSYVEEPNAERTPPYRSLDVSVHWTRAFGRVQLSPYAQVRNVLARDNASTYSGSTPVARRQNRRGETEIVWDDRFERGLPRMPLAGLRLTF